MKNYFVITFLLLWNIVISQNSGKEIFQRITSEVEKFKVDTSAVPNDKLTQEIKSLQKVKGGFNINEAILYKITEDLIKGDISAEDAEKMETFFTNGKGKKWLENAVIWIYRKKFTLSEIKDLNKFYKSSAGKKLSQDFPIIIIESIKSAEIIIEKYKSEIAK